MNKIKNNQINTDYSETFDITKNKSMADIIVPLILMLLITILLGLLCGTYSVVGYLVGSICVIILISVVFTISGMSLENLLLSIHKKSSEEGSPTIDTSSLIGDSIGKVFKNAALSLITFMVFTIIIAIMTGIMAKSTGYAASAVGLYKATAAK